MSEARRLTPTSRATSRRRRERARNLISPLCLGDPGEAQELRADVQAGGGGPFRIDLEADVTGLEEEADHAAAGDEALLLADQQHRMTGHRRPQLRQPPLLGG